MHTIIYDIYTSPCGLLVLGEYDGKLCLCDWLQADNSVRHVVRNRLNRLLKATFQSGDTPLLKLAALQLDEYFAGIREEFSLPLLMVGTDFQLAVWNSLSKIPYGHTGTYQCIGRILDMPRALRAIGNAIGANALSLFVPCHRVIAADGDISGYAGGSSAKRYLLELEGALPSYDL